MHGSTVSVACLMPWEEWSSSHSHSTGCTTVPGSHVPDDSAQLVYALYPTVDEHAGYPAALAILAACVAEPLGQDRPACMAGDPQPKRVGFVGKHCEASQPPFATASQRLELCS